MNVRQELVRRHGGRIAIDTAPGQGTTVTLVLPAALTDSSAAGPGPARDAAGAGRGGQLLVIDDEPGLREILSEALRLDGHEVVTAESGRAALGAFTRQSFDLVLTDLGMPDISGVELARELKATRPDLPVGLISGWDISEESLRAQGATVDFVVRKPFALAAIRSQVRTWLGPR